MIFESPNTSSESVGVRKVDKKKALAAAAMFAAGGVAQAEGGVKLDIDAGQIEQARKAFLSDGEISDYEENVLAGMQHALETGELPPREVGGSSTNLELKGTLDVGDEVYQGGIKYENTTTRTRDTMSPEVAQQRAEREREEYEARQTAEKERLTAEIDRQKNELQAQMELDAQRLHTNNESEKVAASEGLEELRAMMAEHEAEMREGVEQMRKMMEGRVEEERRRHREQATRIAERLAQEAQQALAEGQAETELSDEEWRKKFNQEMRERFGGGGGS